MKSLSRVRKRKGRCYELAFKVMLKEPGAEQFTLIHGRLTRALDGAYSHAWIETHDGKVYDPVLDKSMTVDAYMRLFGAVVERRYTKSEAADAMIKAEHFGPWHLSV